jgi:hypothetical protein
MRTSYALFLVVCLNLIIPAGWAGESIVPGSAVDGDKETTSSVSTGTCSGMCKRRYGGYVGSYVWRLTGGDPDCCSDSRGSRTTCYSEGQKCEPSFSAFAGYRPCSCGTR